MLSRYLRRGIPLNGCFQQLKGSDTCALYSSRIQPLNQARFTHNTKPSSVVFVRHVQTSRLQNSEGGSSSGSNPDLGIPKSSSAGKLLPGGGAALLIAGTLYAYFKTPKVEHKKPQGVVEKLAHTKGPEEVLKVPEELKNTEEIKKPDEVIQTENLQKSEEVIGSKDVRKCEIEDAVARENPVKKPECTEGSLTAEGPNEPESVAITSENPPSDDVVKKCIPKKKKYVRPERESSALKVVRGKCAQCVGPCEDKCVSSATDVVRGSCQMGEKDYCDDRCDQYKELNKRSV